MSHPTPIPETSADTPLEVPTAPKKSRRWLRESLREMGVLVIGILLSLWISNLFQNHKDNERAEVYLDRINKDLSYDLEKLESEYLRRKGQLTSTGTMLGALNNSDQSATHSVLFEGFQQLLWTTDFSAKDATFRSLESSGELRLIQNDSVVDGLMNLYRGSYYSLDANNTDITKYRDNFLLPYVIENVSFRKAFNPMQYSAERIVGNREELYNHLIYESISLGSTVDSYARNIEQVKELRALIGRELKR